MGPPVRDWRFPTRVQTRCEGCARGGRLLRPSLLTTHAHTTEAEGVEARPSGKRLPDNDEEVVGMPVWLLILIIVLVVLALGGFGYSRY